MKALSPYRIAQLLDGVVPNEEPVAPSVPNPYVASARRLVAQAIEASKGFSEDTRLASAQAHLLAALADLIRFQHGIGGKL